MQNKTILLLLSAACLLSVITASGSWDINNYNYIKQGKDWYLHNTAETYLCDDDNVNLRGGKQQSPIDILTTTTVASTKKLLQPSFNNVKGATIKFVGNHTVKVEDSGIGSTNFMHVGDTLTKYDPVQFHFHSPSEHKIDGQFEDLEMHIVHTIDSTVSKSFSSLHGAYLVIGFVFSAKNNKENSFIKGLGLTKGTKHEEVKDIEFKLKELLESIPMKYYHYKGSFTTPPCTEGVNWNVMSTVIDISKDQLAQFTQYFNVTTPTRLRQAAETTGASAWCGGVGNNRVVQPVNSRVILFQDNVDHTVETEESGTYMSTLAIILVVILAILVVVLLVVVMMKGKAGGSGDQKITQQNTEANKLNTSVDVKQ